MVEINVTQADALAALQEAVQTKGADYMYVLPSKTAGYSSCMYTDKSSNPSCIVGHALANLGVPIEVLHAIDWGGAVHLEYDEAAEDFIEAPSESGLEETGICDAEVQHWLKREGIILDEAATDLFGIAQREQDGGVAWGKAVDAAVKYVGRNGR